MAIGLLLRVAAAWGTPPAFASPDARLLAVRLLAVALVAIAVFFPLRALTRNREISLRVAGLLFLLLPGATEALARCANDVAVFCWAAFVLDALRRRTSVAWMCLLLAAGPLLKLTALPVAVFVAAVLWQRNHASGMVALVCSSAIFPIQALRGWFWGGTLELNRRLPEIHESFSHAALGIARSFYTIVKTVFWLGGQSFFRPPTPLVIAWFLLLISFVLSARPRPEPRDWQPHLIAGAVALLGCMVFVLGNRRFYGDWGGVAGWYLWGWAPWLLVAFDDALRISKRAWRLLLPATAIFAVASNVVYFVRAFRLYR